MAKTAIPSDQLRKGAKVVATTDLRDVPEGTPGKVMLVNGFTWVRYWVRFANGVSLGSISRDKLATPAELADLRNGGGTVAADVSDDAADGSEGGDADAGGGVTTPNGTFVPQKFIDRAAAARARLAA